jgi:hypothetical protein
VALALAVGSATAVAVTVTVVAAVTTSLKTPAEEMTPPLADYVTLVLELPLTVAVKACVSPESNVADVGLMITLTAGGGGDEVPPPQAAMASSRRVTTRGAPMLTEKGRGDFGCIHSTPGSRRAEWEPVFQKIMPERACLRL